MSHKKPYKHPKRGGARHVQLPEWLQASDAWATLKPGPRALYVELKRIFNGRNNGEIFLSHRDAAKRLNVHRNTVGPWFEELQERGFIRMTRGPCLGAAGIGQASKWALEEESTSDGKKAGMAFMRWRGNQYPRTKNMTPRHSSCAANPQEGANPAGSVLNFVPQNASERKFASQ